MADADTHISSPSPLAKYKCNALLPTFSVRIIIIFTTILIFTTTQHQY